MKHLARDIDGGGWSVPYFRWFYSGTQYLWYWYRNENREIVLLLRLPSEVDYGWKRSA